MQSEIHLHTTDGIELHGYQWMPDNTPKASIYLIHGLGEHTGRYDWVGNFVNQHGYSLTGFDLRGHGKSQGARGHYDSYDLALDDLRDTLDFVANQNGIPVDFLFGHSLGGNLAINYLLRREHNLKGAVITSPLLQTHFTPPAWKLTLGKLLYNLIPRFSLSNGLDLNRLSRDPQIKIRYQADPLTHKFVSARFGLDFLQAGEWSLQHATDLRTPVLLQIGTQDHIVSVDAAREFARQAPGCDFKPWEGLYHETHNEPEKEEVLGAMVRWLDGQLEKK